MTPASQAMNRLLSDAHETIDHDEGERTMTTELMTENEYADHLVATTRRSAWTLLAVATITSLAGNVLHASKVTSGSIPAMLGASVVPLLLLIGMHLVGGMAAIRREGRAHAAAHRLAVAGITALVLIVFAASFVALRDLLLREGFDPVAATLIPIAVDIAVGVATASLFSIAPRLRRGRSRSARAAAPAPTAVKTAAPVTPRPASVQFTPVSAPEVGPEIAPDTAVVIVESAPEPAPPAAAFARKPAREAMSIGAGSAPDTEALAARIVADRVVKQPLETVTAILDARAAGAKKQRIADDLRIHHSVVGKVMAAAAEDLRPHLTAVGN
jgi:hypothetical protein